MKLNYKYPFFIAAFAALASCKHKEESLPAISGDEIKSHIAVLAADSLMGRKPFTEGETRAVAYISGQFKQLGLEPGNKGSYFQDVPMVEVTSTPSATMTASDAKGKIDLNYLTDFVASTRREVDTVQL